jgi:hypothetical protein
MIIIPWRKHAWSYRNVAWLVHTFPYIKEVKSPLYLIDYRKTYGGLDA